MTDTLNTLRSAVTVLSFLGFAAIVAWAWSRRNRAAFDEAAALPFLDGAAGDASLAVITPIATARGDRHE